MARRTPLGDIGNIPSSQYISSRLESKPKSHLFQTRSPRVDECRRHNHLHVVHLIPDVFEFMKTAEGKFMACPTYMTRQTDINEKMRAILVDWLVDVHLKFKLTPETLYLAVNVVDRFLDQKIVTRSKLQLVGVVGMLLAAKYEEIYPPEIRDFIYISANTYTKDDILKMERLVLSSLDFCLTSPSIYSFLRRALQVVDADQQCQHMALYLSELAVLDYRMLQYSPSIIGAVCVYLARKIQRHPDPWNWVLEYYTTYPVAGLQGAAVLLHEIIQGASQHKCQASRKKFTYPKYGSVADLVDVPLVFP